MNKPITFKVKILSNLTTELLKPADNHVTLGADFMRTVYFMEAKILDDNLNMWVEKIFDVDMTILKRDVDRINRLYYNNDDHYRVEVITKGGSTFDSFDYKNRNEAVATYDLLVKWLLDK